MFKTASGARAQIYSKPVYTALILSALTACGPQGFRPDPNLDATLRANPTPRIEPLQIVAPNPEDVLTSPPEDALILSDRNTSLAQRSNGVQAAQPQSATESIDERAAGLAERANALRQRQ